jgi:hypothetical protein
LSMRNYAKQGMAVAGHNGYAIQAEADSPGTGSHLKSAFTQNIQNRAGEQTVILSTGCRPLSEENGRYLCFCRDC